MLLTRWKIQAEDAVRYNKLLRNGLSVGLLLRASAARERSSADAIVSLSRLCGAARLAASKSLLGMAEKTITRRLLKVRNEEDLKTLLPKEIPNKLAKTLILKHYISDREKGVLFLSFSNQWPKLALLPDLHKLTAQYTLVVAPSWSPPHSLPNYVAPRIILGPIFTLISNERDGKHFRNMSDAYRPVPLYASNWVDPTLFQAVPFEDKTIDVLMVANFGKFKRHHVLFQALRDLPRSLRVVLIGQDEGTRTMQSIRAEARAFEVEDRFEVIQNAPYSRVCELFATSKISLILSLREGSCVAVTESMLADTPVGIFEDAELGSRVFINDKTGRFLRHRNLASQLQAFLDEAANYHPRAWALEHGITCSESSRTLNDLLKKHSIETGAEWTCDLTPLRWTPDPSYSDMLDRERMSDAYRRLHQDFGITVRGFEMNQAEG